VHVGSHTTLEETHATIIAFITAHRLEAYGRNWEVFVSDPGSTPEEELVTEVFYPVK
jgi:effector-binding domain-containing protein